MYHLTNDQLDVAILDPHSDQDRLGTRYCTAGYIFQITDARHGDLMSGPTYPDSFNTFDGQGIPDAFNKTSLIDGSDHSNALVIGIGYCDLDADTVTDFSEWSIKTADHTIEMATSHSHANFELDLTRTVTLTSRTIRSHTAVTTTGKRPIPLNWFPHPFYPHSEETDELCRFNIPSHFPENDGFEFAESGFIARKSWPWQKGHYQALDHDANSPLTVQHIHPKLGLVVATTSYVPGFFPIWGNTKTFSWEPFLERTLAPGQHYSWWIDYQF